MTHRDFAKNAPMGWNSWDCFGAAVNEKQLKENGKKFKEIRLGIYCLRYSMV